MSRINFLALRMAFYFSIIIAFTLIPVSFVEQGSICLIYLTFGVKCFTCGITRGVSNFFHGNFLTAFKFNPLTYAVISLFFLFIISDILLFFRLKKYDDGKYSIFESIFYFVFPKK